MRDIFDYQVKAAQYMVRLLRAKYFDFITEDDLVLAHAHIHLCEAEIASIKKLTPQQMKIYNRIKALLRII